MLVPGVSEALIWPWLYLRLVLFTCRPRRTHYHPTPSHKLIHTGVPASSPRPTTLSLFITPPRACLLHRVHVADCLSSPCHSLPLPEYTVEIRLSTWSVLAKEMWAKVTNIISGETFYKSFGALSQSVSLCPGPRQNGAGFSQEGQRWWWAEYPAQQTSTVSQT